MELQANSRILAIKTVDNILNKNITEKYEVMGIFGIIIFSRIIFESNVDLSFFIEDVFKIEIPKYIVKSRPLLIGKVQKIIFKQEINETKIVLKNVKKIFRDIIKEEIKNDSNFYKQAKPDYSKKNENEKLEIWLKGL